MTSQTTADFRRAYAALPTRIQRQARKNYRLWLRDPQHPSLDFKLVGRRTPSYSVRVSIGWRALGLKHGQEMIWFWIGSHADYDRLLKTLSKTAPRESTSAGRRRLPSSETTDRLPRDRPQAGQVSHLSPALAALQTQTADCLRAKAES